ncbi:MAG: putative glycine-rich RNA-binding protein 2, mitochondrial precursor, partial [Olpidium bornovanus]
PAKLFIGGLAWSTDSASLRSAFEPFGDVEDAVVINDRETGRSRGFGFVTFSSLEGAEKAIEMMHDQNLHGRTIRVDHASGGGYARGGGFSSGGFQRTSYLKFF